jgi:hypothetical protein
VVRKQGKTKQREGGKRTGENERTNERESETRESEGEIARLSATRLAPTFAEREGKGIGEGRGERGRAKTTLGRESVLRGKGGEDSATTTTTRVEQRSDEPPSGHERRAMKSVKKSLYKPR